MSGTFRRPGSTGHKHGVGPRHRVDQVQLLHASKQLSVPSPAPDKNVLAKHVRVHLEGAKEDEPERTKSIAEISTKLARRATALQAFRRKYYSTLFDEVGKNASGNLRGLVVSAKWRHCFEAFGQFGAALEIAGLPIEAANASWEDSSVTGLFASSMATVSRWATKSVALGATKTVLIATELIGKGIGLLEFQELEADFRTFTTNLDSSVQDVERAIDRVLSFENARDALSPRRSVLNPHNWGLLVEGLEFHGYQTAHTARELHQSVTNAIQEYFSDHV